MTEEPKHRLQIARAAKGFERPSDAARALKINKNTLISHENGNRKISLKAALLYGKAFDVDPAWLVYGPRTEDTMDMPEAVDRVLLDMKLAGKSADDDLGQDDATANDESDGFDPGALVTSVPLVSWVSAGSLKKSDGVTSAEIERYVPVANLPRGDWMALTVRGDSMDRIAPEGSIIVLNHADDTLLNDRYYVFSLEGGEATFKRYRSSPRPMLQPFSTNLDHMSIPANEGEFYVVGRVRRVITDV